MSNKLYDILKFIAQIVLPAIATFYAAVGGIWAFPLVEEVVGTISAIDAFMGAILAYFKSKYDKEQECNNEPEGSSN